MARFLTAPMLAIGALAASVPTQAAEDGGAALNAVVKARLAEESGRPGAALSALITLAGYAPDFPGLRGRMLEQAIQAGDLAAARSAASQMWEGGDLRFDAQLVLVVDAVRRSDWKAARAYMNGRSDKTGGDLVARLLQPTIDAWIDVAAREKQPERHLLAAGRGGGGGTPPAFQAALVQLAVRRPADAVALTDQSRPTDRISQLVALRLAATLDKAGEGDAAQRLRQRTALASGAREDPLLLLPEQPISTPRAGIAQWLALLADSFARTPNGNPKVPLLFARSAYWLDDQDWAVRSALVETLDGNGQAGDAMAVVAAKGAKTPPVLVMRRAELVADAGDLPGAVKLAQAATASPAPARNLLVRFADIARRSGDAKAAGDAYARLESTLGDGADDQALRGTLLIARADLLLQGDDWAGAEALMERAVALRPGDATVLNFAGYSALERRKNVPASLARIEAAWKSEPQNPSITDSLGWAYLLTGRVDDAVPLLESAQRGEPDNAVIVEHLGDAYWQAGRRFQARYTWRAAVLIADVDMATRLEAKLRDGLTPATMAP